MKIQKRALVPLFLIIFIDSMGYGLLIPVLLRLFHGTNTQFFGQFSPGAINILFGVGISLSALASFMTGPMIGAMSDQWGRKLTLLLCVMASCVGFCMPIFGFGVGSLLLVFVGRAIAGAAQSSQPIAQAVIADVSEGKQKAVYLSVVACVMTVAMVVGPLMGGLLSDPHIVSWFNLTTPFYIAAGLAFVNIILLLVFFQETHQREQSRVFVGIKDFFGAITTACFNRNLRGYCVAFFCYEFAWSLYFQDLGLYRLQVFHHTVADVSIFMAYVGVWMALGLLVAFPMLVKRFEVRRVWQGSLWVAAVSLLLLAAVPIDWVHWVMVAFLAVSVGMAYPANVSLLSDKVDATRQGWIMGVAFGLLALSWWLSAMLSGVLTDIGVSLPYWVAFGMMGLASVLAVLPSLQA